MDDSKSDNTDDLLTSIEPLIQQSEFLVKQEEYRNSKWLRNRMVKDFDSKMPVIVDDILSSRSAVTENGKGKSTFQSPSIANLASHNSRLHEEHIHSDRTASSHFYEASISAQSTPRNLNVNRPYVHVVDKNGLSQQLFYNTESLQLHGELDETRSAFNQSKTEIQRLQLNNKQLTTQLHEAKLSIQTLTIQLEQVQQESRHKENTLANLDNTLGKLVTSWKKRETQKEQNLDSMKQEINCKEKIIEECQRMTEESRRALSNADKAVQMERSRLEQVQKGASVEIQNLKNERGMIMKNNAELGNRCIGLEAEMKRLSELCAEKVHCIDALNFEMKENYLCWQRDNENLKKEIDGLKEEALTRQFEVQCREDKLCQMKMEMKMLEDEVNRFRRERDDKNGNLSALRNEMKKMQDEHAVALKKQEKDLLCNWQQELSKRVQDLQDQHKRTLQTLQSNFQGKLNEQSKRHRTELDRLRHVAEQEIASRASDSEETIAMLRERLDRSEKSVQFWQQEKEVVERARNQISSQLYEIMNGTCSRPTTGLVTELVKPVFFVPPKNQNLLQTMPNNFFEPIKSGLTPTMLSTGNSTRENHISSEKNQALLSSSSASLFY